MALMTDLDSLINENMVHVMYVTNSSNQLKDEYVQVDQLVTADTSGHLGHAGEGVVVAGVVALEPVLTALEA